MTDKITREMPISQIVRDFPQAAEIFFKYGLHCLGCAAARFENVEQGAMAHGIDVEALMKDLNASVA